MAKRKRLTPANPAFLEGAHFREPGTGYDDTSPETNLGTLGSATERSRFTPRARAPIAEIAADVSAAAALEELSGELARAREESRLIQRLPLGEIDRAHLVRDRMQSGGDDLLALEESLRTRGQQVPIEVVDRGQGQEPRYGLISGWRRLSALARLAEDDPKFNHVLALVRAPKTASEAYVAMVEENEIRVGLSYYERARIVLKAVEEGVYPDLKTSLGTLFGNVSRAKRSKIKSFTRVVEGLDGVLAFPTAIGERLGLQLARQLEEDPNLQAELQIRLREAEPTTAEAEQAVLLRRPNVSRAKRMSDSSQSIQTFAQGAFRLRYDPAKERAVLTGLDENTHAALMEWLRRR